MLIAFIQTSEADVDQLVSIRIAAMRESLTMVGRFEPERARSRFLSSFDPRHCYFLKIQDQTAGFFSLHREEGAFSLQHMYLLPEYQRKGIGSQALKRILAGTDRWNLPVKVGALRGSDSNRFYQHHGFIPTHEEEWDIYYLRAPAGRANANLSPGHNALYVRSLIPRDIAGLEVVLRQHVRDIHTGEVVEEEVRAICRYMAGSLDAEARLRSYLVICDEHDAPLGCMALAEPEGRMARHFPSESPRALELLNAFVHQDAVRMKGLGRTLLDASCADAMAAGAEFLVVNSGPRYRHGWGFYDRTFDQSHGMLPDYYGVGRHAKTWSKKLL